MGFLIYYGGGQAYCLRRSRTVSVISTTDPSDLAPVSTVSSNRSHFDMWTLLAVVETSDTDAEFEDGTSGASVGAR